MSSDFLSTLKYITKVVPPEHAGSVEKALLQELGQQFSQDELEAIPGILESHGQDWGFNPSHPIAAKAIERLLFHLVGPQDIQGWELAEEALAKAKAGERVVMVGNHLSYGDANFLQAQLAMQGLEHYPLLVMAGPKVYTDPFRRFSSMCFDTLKMAQPPSRASDGADVSMRELAEITRKVMKEADEHQQKGSILYFFPEGSRTRSGGLERFIPASARYCNHAGTTVYPIGFTGTEGLLGVDGKGIQLDDMHIRIGKGISFDATVSKLPQNPAQQRKAWVDLLGYGVAAQLPESKRGVYKDPNPDLELEDWRHLLPS